LTHKIENIYVVDISYITNSLYLF